MCVALGAILSGILLAGCSSGSSTQTAAPAAQMQQTNTSGQQPSNASGQPSGRGWEGMTKVIARAATILGVSETDLTTAFNAAIKSVFGDRPARGSGSDNRTHRFGSDNKTPPSSQPPSGQPGQGQPPSGSSDMMPSVYSKIATALNLSADKVKAAFEQAQSELKQ